MTPNRAGVPPGWPAAVPAPQVPNWEHSAVAWLLDLCPADYRGYPVLARHPVALARVTLHHVEADLQAGRRAVATARAELAEVLPEPVVEQVIDALDAEQARLLSARRGVLLVEEALRGHRHIPRL